MNSLNEYIQHIDNNLQRKQELSIQNEYAPFGMIKIEEKSCTACGLCANNCPTGAISIKPDQDNSKTALSFRHDQCIACGICRNICPEKCIKLTNTLDMSQFGSAQTVFEDEYAYCRNCKGVIAPKSMVTILKSKLKQHAGSSTEWSELCPSCRVVLQRKR
jgi:formate hydrogenlyase subunit 6/NADH:ubiquinone oxidoreductase subunit I